MSHKIQIKQQQEENKPGNTKQKQQKNNIYTYHDTTLQSLGIYTKEMKIYAYTHTYEFLQEF